ncbi:MAG: hypothetical protein JSS83_16005 [Cyanobacteria bacterium SZAS LIN-3]|nr:hypothetical protein [Cyanobacteria bacterium SZAS LIN-3]
MKKSLQMLSGGILQDAGALCVTKVSPSRYFHMIRNLAALIALTAVFSGSFALSTESVEAKTSRNSTRKSRNYFVPPPPPYTPSMLPTVLGMTNPQQVPADAYSMYIVTRNQGAMQQAVQPKPQVSYNTGVEPKVLKQVDDIDSEISSIGKGISKLLNL